MAAMGSRASTPFGALGQELKRPLPCLTVGSIIESVAAVTVVERMLSTGVNEELVVRILSVGYVLFDAVYHLDRVVIVVVSEVQLNRAGNTQDF